MDFYTETREKISNDISELLELKKFGDEYYGSYSPDLYGMLECHLLDELERNIKFLMPMIPDPCEEKLEEFKKFLRETKFKEK